jgi:hypothetical protein
VTAGGNIINACVPPHFLSNGAKDDGFLDNVQLLGTIGLSAELQSALCTSALLLTEIDAISSNKSGDVIGNLPRYA